MDYQIYIECRIVLIIIHATNWLDLMFKKIMKFVIFYFIFSKKMLVCPLENSTAKLLLQRDWANTRSNVGRRSTWNIFITVVLMYSWRCLALIMSKLKQHSGLLKHTTCGKLQRVIDCGHMLHISQGSHTHNGRKIFPLVLNTLVLSTCWWQLDASSAWVCR